jgi:PAS domain S-box-containing protein
VGLLADEWALWSRKTGVRANVQGTDLQLARQQVLDGHADVIDPLVQTADGQRLFDYTQPYAEVPVLIYAARDISGITDIRALRGLQVAVKSGDACERWLRNGGVTQTVRYPSYQAIVDAAVTRRVQIFCMDGPPARYLLYRSGAADRFNEAFTLSTGGFHRAVRKGDAQTLALVDLGFAAITPAEQQALNDKWLGAPLPDSPWPRALRWIVAGLLLVALAIALWGLTMRRVVREKTALIDNERRRLRTLIDTLPDLVWFKSVEGRFLACNERFERFIGAPESALIGRTEAIFLDAATAHTLSAADRDAITSGAPCKRELTLTYADDGHQEVVESLHTPVFDAPGQLAGVLGIGRDVTQRRDAEQHLRRLNRLYQVLSGVHAAIVRERAPWPLYAAVCRIMVEDGGLRMAWVGCPDHATGELVPVAWAGAAGTYLEAPHASLAVGPLGNAPSATAFREGRSVHSTDIAQDPMMAAWRQAAAAHGFCSSSAYPLRARDRTVAVFTMYSGTVEFFDAAELALLDRLTRDISHALETYELDEERERAVAALRGSEVRFATMFKTNPTGLALGRMSDTCFLDINESFTKMFGYEPEEVIGRSGTDLRMWVDPDARGAAMQTLRDQGEVRDLEARFRKRDGDVFFGSFSATRVSIGNEELMIVSLFDLTAQRLATRTLEERKLELERVVTQRTAELSNVLDAMPDLYLRMRRDGTIVDCRAGRESGLPAEPAELIGRTVRDVLPAQAAESLHAAIEESFAADGIVIVEYPLPHADGERYFEARMRPLGADQAIAFVRNITDRRSLEADRERARLRAVELANAKSEFLANMSHEIRTPLNGLLGLAQVGLRGSADPGTRDTFGAILDSGRLLLGVVNDVLDFSKIEVGKLRIEQSPVSPRTLATDAVALLRERADAKGISLELEIDASLPAQCLGDALRTQQVLVNLLSNAVKFTEHGGVMVWVGREPAIVDLAASDVVIESGCPLQLVFRVSDSGIGIGPEQLGQLFTAFQQADTSTTRRFGGTGLGLAISRRLAQLMGGDILVHSTPGRGSTFELRLPCLESGPPAAQPSAAQALGADTPPRLAGVRVLVAEDNEVNQVVLERALTMEGACPVIVGDGRQAVNRVQRDGRGAFDVVLMDIQMPEMDGYEATRRILALAPDLPVIGQTAHAMQDERLECLAAGMVDHVAKPIDFAQLFEVITRHVK